MARKSRSEAGAQAESDLKYWGYHVGKQFAADGYPAENPLLTLLCGHSDLNPLSPRFGVNTKDIPADAWHINSLIVTWVPGYERRTLIGRYCLPVDYETGQPIAPSLIAEAMGLHLRAYYRLLEKARIRFSEVRSSGLSFASLTPCIESMT
jgi:hypothetical protein